MQSAFETWYQLFGKLMKQKNMTMEEAIDWCKPFTGDELKKAYEKFATI